MSHHHKEKEDLFLTLQSQNQTSPALPLPCVYVLYRNPTLSPSPPLPFFLPQGKDAQLLTYLARCHGDKSKDKLKKVWGVI